MRHSFKERWRARRPEINQHAIFAIKRMTDDHLFDVIEHDPNAFTCCLHQANMVNSL
jgi:hypothetical protein